MRTTTKRMISAPARHRSAQALALLLCAASLAACASFDGSASGDPTYDVATLRPGAQVTAANTEDRTDFDIYSETGIGSAAVRLLSGSWPATVVLRFHLRGLENLEFAYGETLVSLSLTTEQRVLQSVSSSASAAQPIDEDSPYWMPLRILDAGGQEIDAPAAGGVIEVMVPADFLGGDYGEFAVSWIDFYR